MGEIQSRSFQPPVRVGFQCSRLTPDDDLISGRKLDGRHKLLRWMFLLVRKKHSWSPVLLAVELWRLLINIGKYREIFRLFKLKPFVEIAQDNPGFSLKYLVPDYLARGFTGTECVSCFLHHYKRIHAALPESVLRQILQGNITLYEVAEGGNRFAFTMGLPDRNVDKEGELSLDLRVDGKKIFDLCFTIVPGWVLKSEAPEALLISRLQGLPGCCPQIKAARKALNDYSPRILLLAALQGIGDALGVGEIEAVSATNQMSYIKGCSALFKNGYDGFFTKAGMVKTSVGFYSSPIPIAGKPLGLFRGRARLRARKRRANRQQIRAACSDFLSKIGCRAADSTPGTLC